MHIFDFCSWVLEGIQQKRQETSCQHQHSWLSSFQRPIFLGTFCFCRCTFKALGAILAKIRKKSRRIMSIHVNVTEHGWCTIVFHVIHLISKRAGEFLEGIAAEFWRVIRPFALASDDCVVLSFTVYRASWKVSWLQKVLAYIFQEFSVFNNSCRMEGLAIK